MDETMFRAWMAERRECLKAASRARAKARAQERRKNGTAKPKCLVYKCGRVRVNGFYCSGHRTEYMPAVTHPADDVAHAAMDCREPHELNEVSSANKMGCDMNQGSDEPASVCDTSVEDLTDPEVARQHALRFLASTGLLKERTGGEIAAQRVAAATADTTAHTAEKPMSKRTRVELAEEAGAAGSPILNLTDDDTAQSHDADCTRDEHASTEYVPAVIDLADPAQAKAHALAFFAGQGVRQDSKMWNFTCINVSTSHLLQSVEQCVPAVNKCEDALHISNLRQCQREALDKMTTAFVVHGTFILGLPPGARKTLTCILFCVHEAARRFTEVVVVSPQKAQVAQTKGRFDAILNKLRRAYTSTLVDTDGSTNVDHISSRSSAPGNVHYVHTTFASAKKVAASLQTPRNKVLIIVDEAHRYTDTLLGELMAAGDSHILLSGTWCGISASAVGDGDAAAWRYTMTISDAEKAGIIVPQRFVLPCNVNLDEDNLEMRAEFIATTTMRLSDSPRRHILYSFNVRQAQQLANLVVVGFRRNGMVAEAEVVTGDTPNAERERIFKWMSEGTRKVVRIISSVHVLDEGIDIPAVDCVYIGGTGGDNCRYVQRVCRSICGTNAGLLNNAASKYKESRNWTSALEQVLQVPSTVINDAIKGGAGWTPEQFAVAAQLILDRRHNAVTQGLMETELGRLSDVADANQQEKAGAQALKALMKNNFVAMRPYSDWAFDLPKEVYVTTLQTQAVVTAYNPAHLHAMRTFRPVFDTRLQIWQSQKQIAATVKEIAETTKELADNEQHIADTQDERIKLWQSINVVTKQMQDVIAAGAAGLSAAAAGTGSSSGNGSAAVSDAMAAAEARALSAVAEEVERTLRLNVFWQTAAEVWSQHEEAPALMHIQVCRYDPAFTASLHCV
ncbi:P-loop containing nucleoside triphosphate hydrolase protein [Tribonema minus]|uniref:P-loop containing nucleoside triphosphate hydrolase protein n=1 Tax=Tribonema minus TaxID=303371 RepID=A0A836CJN2_9STRA|nr:P-loop containing nucleoside triphosphate hydrolase protein [Tribonema minus]